MSRPGPLVIEYQPLFKYLKAETRRSETQQCLLTAENPAKGYLSRLLPGTGQAIYCLLKLVSAYSLPKVSQIITMLEKIPTTVNSEKIRLILERKEEPVRILAPCAITRQAKRDLE